MVGCDVKDLAWRFLNGNAFKKIIILTFRGRLFVCVVLRLTALMSPLLSTASREAARECRRKKKEYVRCLENRVAVLENQNKTLIEELRALKDIYHHKVE